MEKLGRNSKCPHCGRKYKVCRAERRLAAEQAELAAVERARSCMAATRSAAAWSTASPLSLAAAVLEVMTADKTDASSEASGDVVIVVSGRHDAASV